MLIYIRTGVENLQFQNPSQLSKLAHMQCVFGFIIQIFSQMSFVYPLLRQFGEPHNTNEHWLLKQSNR